MSTLVICALLACLIPFLAKAPLAWAQQQSGGYDNRHPRAQQQALTGFGARALAAHQNSFESLIVFAVALAVVLGTNTSGAVMDTLAITYLLARVLYCLCYWYNWHVARSLIWALSLACPLAMIALCI
ncbi:MAPEG family protein [Pseudoalteromonas sp. T1lg75]|uniref:MAPEG family protein n=1 Tax=Pseudoalteromonas sp. T1lg75 TaxID=2077102 RepID=UPI000CF7282B|nr:MAPEG family protein [Pseudoalteromonas sp. T1lg75]